MRHFKEIVRVLSSGGISSPRLEARLLLAFVLQCDSSSAKVLTASLTTEQEAMMQNLLQKRLEDHFPLDKILGYKEFYKYVFKVNEDVLSPRPETEILVEEAIRINGNKKINILDLGTGSGCILLSLLKENQQAKGIGVDISVAALEVAKQNASKLGVEQQVRWLQASWFDEDFLQYFSDSFDMIVSNPPYIPEEEIASLDKEVREHDPMSALGGGKDGLTSYRRLAEITPMLLSQEGYLLLECGANQANQVVELFKSQGLKVHNILKDLQNIERCIILKK